MYVLIQVIQIIHQGPHRVVFLFFLCFHYVKVLGSCTTSIANKIVMYADDYKALFVSYVGKKPSPGLSEVIRTSYSYARTYPHLAPMASSSAPNCHTYYAITTFKPRFRNTSARR